MQARHRGQAVGRVNRAVLVCAAGMLAGVGAASPVLAYNSVSPTFGLVAIPDPQYETLSDSRATTYYNSEMNWVVANRNNSTNIAFVSGMGDNQQDGNYLDYPTNTVPNTAEWQRASAAWDILKNNNVPYYTVIGNHDYMHWSTINTPTMWNQYFSPSRYSGTTALAGWNTATDTASRPYNGLDTYTYFYAGGYKFLSLNLQFNPDSNDMAWAQGVLNLAANKGLPTIVTTHNYQDNNGRDSAGTALWNGLINNNSQIFMVLSGHISGTRQQTSTDAAGQPVFEVLTDYQDYPQAYAGGQGYLRLFNFNLSNPSNMTVHAQTYSPALGTYITSGTGASAADFTLSMNFLQRFGAAPYLQGKSFYWDPGQGKTNGGGGAGTWDSSTGNWYDGVSADVAWSTAGITDAAVFGGAAGGAVTVASGGVSVNDLVFKTAGYTLSGGTITMVGTPTIDTSAAATTINNVLAGNAGVTLNGGPVTLTAVNTFTGGLTVSGGATVNISTDRNLGAASGAVTLDGGTMTYTGTAAATLTGRVFTIGSNGGTFNVTNPGTSGGKIVINGTNYITGSGDITKNGPGWMTIYGNGGNNASGDWTINGGVVETAPANGLGTGSVTVNSGGELALNNGSTALANAVTLNSGSTIGADNSTTLSTGTFSGPVTAGGNFAVRLGNFWSGSPQNVTISGPISGTGSMTTMTAAGGTAGTLKLTGDNSLYSGGINIAAGTVAVGATAGRPLGTGPITLSGGRLALGGQATQTGAAASSMSTVGISGFNKDVIYANPDTNGTTTTTMDGSYAFFQNQFIPATGMAAAGTQLTGGMDSPNITSAVGNTVYAAKGQTVNTPFALQSFIANNVLQFNQGSTGTVTLNVPGTFANLAVLATSGYATNDTPNVKINFTDGTSATTTYKAYDWYMNSDATKLAASAFGSAGIERYSATQGWDQRAFSMYESDIDLTNIGGVDYSNKAVASLTFNAAYSDAQGRGKTSIFAVSGTARTWVASTAQNYANAVAVTADSGIDVSGALTASLGPLTMGAAKLSVSSADTTGAPYSLTFGATTVSGNAAIDVASSAGGGSGKVVLGAVAGSGSLSKSGAGRLTLASGGTIGGGLTVSGGTVELRGNLSMGGLALSGGTLDTGSNDVVVHYAGASSPADLVRGYLQSGRNGGSWGGAGISSSSAAGNAGTAIGYAEASQVLGLSGSTSGSWDGMAVDGSSLLLKYTWAGDANMDGKITADDYALIDRGFSTHPANAHWTDGDFNYDGVISSADYMLIDTAYGLQNGVLSPGLLAEREAQFGTGYVQQLTAAVPEPAGLALAAVLALAGGRRRGARGRRA